MTHQQLRSAIEAALSPGHFFLPADKSLRIEYLPSMRIPWEIFRGHLLDERQTRQIKDLESWNVSISNGEGNLLPAVSIHHDGDAHLLFVTRSLQVYAWETYEEKGALLTRETQRWQRELIATIEL